MSEEVQKKGMSKGTKWATGCGVGCLVTIALAARTAWLIYPKLAQ